MIASLPMYDLAGVRGATDRLWQALREQLPDAPEALNRDTDPWTGWQSPDLLLGQTCGLPFRARLSGRVTYVASPMHGLPDCPPGYYFSRLIRRAGDDRTLAALARGIMAVNDGLSQSGWAAPAAHLAQLGLALPQVLSTGAHLASVEAVATGRADFAAVDAVTWAMACDAGETRVEGFERTRPTPALPYITAKGRDPAPIRRALGGAIATLTPKDRAALHLQGVTEVPIASYLAEPLPPDLP